MKNLVTFSKQANGYIDFQVKAGYYAGYEMGRELAEVMYVPNGTKVGSEVSESMAVGVPVHTDKSVQEYANDYSCYTHVKVYSKKLTDKNCPPGWRTALCTYKTYGEYQCFEIKEILFTRPFQMKEVAKFLRQELSIEEAKGLYKKEMEVINIRPMRVFDVLEFYEIVPAERVLNQNLTMEEAQYVSRDHYGMVHSQQPFSFFGENQFPVFYRGELLYTGERRTNDTFKIALPPQEKVAFTWSDDEAGDGDTVALLQILN